MKIMSLVVDYYSGWLLILLHEREILWHTYCLFDGSNSIVVVKVLSVVKFRYIVALDTYIGVCIVIDPLALGMVMVPLKLTVFRKAGRCSSGIGVSVRITSIALFAA
ncbi:hypothetical protein Tco_0767741 [Tanacetum coccineum]